MRKTELAVVRYNGSETALPLPKHQKQRKKTATVNLLNRLNYLVIMVFIPDHREVGELRVRQRLWPPRYCAAHKEIIKLTHFSQIKAAAISLKSLDSPDHNE